MAESSTTRACIGREPPTSATSAPSGNERRLIVPHSVPHTSSRHTPANLSRQANRPLEEGPVLSRPIHPHELRDTFVESANAAECFSTLALGSVTYSGAHLQALKAYSSGCVEASSYGPAGWRVGIAPGLHAAPGLTKASPPAYHSRER